MCVRQAWRTTRPYLEAICYSRAPRNRCRWAVRFLPLNFRLLQRHIALLRVVALVLEHFEDQIGLFGRRNALLELHHLIIVGCWLQGAAEDNMAALVRRISTSIGCLV